MEHISGGADIAKRMSGADMAINFLNREVGQLCGAVEALDDRLARFCQAKEPKADVRGQEPANTPTPPYFSLLNNEAERVRFARETLESLLLRLDI